MAGSSGSGDSGSSGSGTTYYDYGGGLLAGGINFIGSLINNLVNGAIQQGYNKENMAIQQRYNERNMAFQYGYSQELMQKQHDLNSYSQQIKDLRQAGLSPSLLLSGQQEGQTSLGSSPSGGSPSSSNPVLDSMPQLLQSALLKEQIKKQKIENNYAPSLSEANLKQLDNLAKKLGAEANFTEGEFEIQQASKQFVVAKSAADLDEALVSIKQIEQSIRESQSRERLNDVNVESVEQDVSLKDFRRQLRDVTGVDYDANQWSLVFQLASQGKLSPIFENLVKCAKDLIKTIGKENGLTGDLNVEQLLKIGRLLNPSEQLLDLLFNR